MRCGKQRMLCTKYIAMTSHPIKSVLSEVFLASAGWRQQSGNPCYHFVLINTQLYTQTLSPFYVTFRKPCISNAEPRIPALLTLVDLGKIKY